ncbi:MAG TPA: macro domain-containing protein [Clostridiaceae bacterium]|nr:macro domain-containing protein [Clostridiaceae bacterium]
MPFTIIRQDITKMEVDAIVNAANTELRMGGGVCGAIFRAAGAAKLQAACDKLAPIKTGEAVITSGFNLPARFVIHTAGPVYNKQNPEESERLLRSAYTESLRVAIENECESIAFPLISSGIYGYPKDEALQVATSAIRDFLHEHDIAVFLVLFDKSSFVISNKLLGDVKSYIDEHYVELHEAKRSKLLAVERQAMRDAAVYLSEVSFEITAEPADAAAPLEDLVGNLDEPFSEMLLRLIDAKCMTDVEVYKRANLDRKLFSKIRSTKDYTPSKRTAIALALALGLSLDETDAFLERAGFALSRAVKFDVIVEYFIVNGIYDIFAINEVLFEYDQPLL